MNSIYNKNILIFGAASGIGRAFAIACAREKANIIALDSSKQELAELEREIGNMKSNIRTYPSGFATSKAAEQTMKEIYNNHDKIDVFLTGSPSDCGISFLKTDFSAIEKIIFSHVTIPSVVCRYVFERMLKMKEAVIIGMPPFFQPDNKDGILRDSINGAAAGLFAGVLSYSGKTKSPVLFINAVPSADSIEDSAAAVLIDAIFKNKQEVKI